MQVRQAGGYLAGVRNVIAGVPSGGAKCHSRRRLQPGLKLWFHPDPMRRCSKLFNLNWWKGHCYHYKIFLIMVPRVGGRGPILSGPPIIFSDIV